MPPGFFLLGATCRAYVAGCNKSSGVICILLGATYDNKQATLRLLTINITLSIENNMSGKWKQHIKNYSLL